MVIFLNSDTLYDMRDAFLEAGDRLDPDSMGFDWDVVYECVILGCARAAIDRSVVQVTVVRGARQNQLGTVHLDRIRSEVYEAMVRVVEPRPKHIHDRSQRLLTKTNYQFYRGLASELIEMPVVGEVFAELSETLPDDAVSVDKVVIRGSRVDIHVKTERQNIRYVRE